MEDYCLTVFQEDYHWEPKVLPNKEIKEIDNNGVLYNVIVVPDDGNRDIIKYPQTAIGYIHKGEFIPANIIDGKFADGDNKGKYVRDYKDKLQSSPLKSIHLVISKQVNLLKKPTM
jgi:hypothetical protein